MAVANRIIDQQLNFRAQFGPVFRSSGIFFCPAGIKTTLSVMDYFQFKNSSSVGVVVTSRSMSGDLLERKTLSFDEAYVLNMEFHSETDHSVELEFFGSKDLRIPYAAVLAVYEARRSVSMVHNYSRDHSLHELENGTAILEGNETCWFVEDVRRIEENTNFAVFHNGHKSLSPQIAEISATQLDDQELIAEFSLPTINPYSTQRWDLADIAGELLPQLKPGPAWFRLRFRNSSSFPRLLLVEQRSEGEFQTTHSDIDYSRVGTDEVASAVAYVGVPAFLNRLAHAKLEIDPGHGDYIIEWDDGVEVRDMPGGAVIELQSQTCVVFRERGGKMPSRLHAAFTGGTSLDEITPFRTCVGTVHASRPPKHSHWMLAAPELQSTFHLVAYPQIYVAPNEVQIKFSLFSSVSRVVLQKEVTYSSLPDVPSSFQIQELFPSFSEFLNGQFGYLWLNSNYGGFFMFVSLEKGKSLSLEHSF